MKPCANLTWLFGEVPFLDRFAAAAAAGFAGGEILSPYDHPIADLKARLDETGLELVLINSPSGDRAAGERGTACIPGREAEFRASIDTALDYATALGCRMIHMMAGVRPPGLSADTAAALYAVNLAWAAEQAGQAGLTLLVEAINGRDIPGYHVSTQEGAVDVIAALAPAPIGLQFDVYHCQTAQGDVTRRLETLFPLIRHVQVADVPARTEPGTGEIAWPHVFARLRTLGYDGWIGAEYRPSTTTRESLAWTRHLAGGYDPETVT